MEHYPEIWYLGLEARKIHGEEGAPQNGGYDDENGSYHKVRIVLNDRDWFQLAADNAPHLAFVTVAFSISDCLCFQ